MALGIGIDTGGTYTDAVIYDFERNEVLAGGKARTVKEDLASGICAALDHLPLELAQQASVVSLSTTLATNACVEGKGGRAKVVLVGTNERVLRRLETPSKFGFSYDEALCIDISGAYDGSSVTMPDWDAFMEENVDALAQAQAFGIAEVYAERNGAVVEYAGARALAERFGVPVIVASSLVNGLNMIERGATAVLNARLLPVIEEFLDAATQALAQRGIKAPIMIMRSDASLMNEAFARSTPVETMVSGPAASVQGCHALARVQDTLIVDMGGTTSDFSLVEGGVPAMTDGIRIGNWRTQVHGVFIDTIGLGGDSAVTFSGGNIGLAETRVEPLCMAVSRWPQLLERIEDMVNSEPGILRPLYEVLYLVREPQPNAVYTSDELKLIELLREGPKLIWELTDFEYFQLERDKVPERLESEGIVMRSGLTPTDIMHIKGDFTRFDRRASELAVNYLCNFMSIREDEGSAFQMFCDAVYDAVKRKLYTNIVRVLFEHRYPKRFANGFPCELEAMFEQEWETFAASKRASAQNADQTCAQAQQADEDRARVDYGDGLKLEFSLNAPIVGVGAPIHVFLPDVAEALGTTCVIPEHAEIANAIGAVVASVAARVTIRILADWSPGGIVGYIVNANENRVEYETLDEAKQFARETAIDAARQLAYERGASDPLHIMVTMEDRENYSGSARLYRGTDVIATATPEQS